MAEMVRVNFPGLFSERLPSGSIRWRVRKEGDPKIKTTLRVAPGHPRFGEHYHAARAGIQLDAEPDAPVAIKGSVSWLADLYIEAMQAMLAAGHLQAGTVQQRTVFIERLRADAGEYSAAMPQSELIKRRDKMMDTPGAADNFVKAVRAMYAWGIERGHVRANPATGIGRINQGTGATPWTVDDLKKYRERHPAGTMAHLALSLFMFTACRIGDAVRLGRANEALVDGVAWLDWTPEKKGSARVRIPIAPPLLTAIRSQVVTHPAAYLLTEQGQPFASKDSFSRRFAKWCDQAGLKDRSAHGVRKAAGELMALHGLSQYHVMAVHGHTQAKTSEVYTQGANRARLAEQAMQKLAGIEW